MLEPSGIAFTLSPFPPFPSTPLPQNTCILQKVTYSLSPTATNGHKVRAPAGLHVQFGSILVRGDKAPVKLQNLLGGPFPVNFNETDQPQYLSFLQQQIEITYDLKEAEMELIEVGLFRELEKSFILQQIDNAWTEHLQKMELIK